jgi:diaminopropionate ammonia-lyase
VRVTSRFLFNDGVLETLGESHPSRAPLEFHKRLPGYEPTPLHRLSALAGRLGVGEILLKDESIRLGLPAFKILGASWATYREVVRLLGDEPEDWSTVEELRPRLEKLTPLELVTATDGNHGRAVARVAALLGLGARIFVPAGTVEPRIAGIQSEGATVVVVEGTYDQAVLRAAEAQGDRTLLIQDMSYLGYERIPQRVIEGYSTMFWEIEDALAEAGESGPDLVLVQVGVGSLAAAVVRHYRRSGIDKVPHIVSVEPTGAACALAAFENNSVITIPGPHDSIMAGLNCGTLATVAWPVISKGIDCFRAVDDERSREAMRQLAAVGIVSGESGAAGLAGLLETVYGNDSNVLRRRLGLTGSSRVLILSTEGATDPQSYVRIVGRSHTDVRAGPA